VPDQPYLVPFRRLKKLICLPYVWEDGSHFGEPNDLQSLGLDRDGLLIYNFHPIHVFLNTISTQGYHRSRRFYQDTPALFLRRAQGVGTRDQFVGFLEWMHKHPECCSQTCGEIVKGIEDEGR